jgi:hypothetical protein
VAQKSVYLETLGLEPRIARMNRETTLHLNHRNVTEKNIARFNADYDNPRKKNP